MERYGSIESVLRAEIVEHQQANDALQRALDAERRERHAVEQVAGQALGYPWFKDDQKNFPGATEADGVCIGEHVAGTIVQELASKRAALQADNECKDSLIETLQAQLRQAEGERDAHAQDVDELIECCINDVLVTHATPGGKPHDPDPQIRPLRDKIAGSLVELQALRQLVEALPVLDMRFESVAVGPLGWTVGGVTFGKVTEANAYSALLQYRATLAAQDAGKEVSSG